MNTNIKLNRWIKAARLRTLPLAFSSIFLGSAIAYFYGKFELNILILTLLTTLCLQILSNFSNDYGDSIHGADHSKRKGPSRAVQSGEISLESMKKVMILFAALAFFFGLSLLVISFNIWSISFFVFLFLLLVSIFAAITYTSGNNPYGYKALGDLSVFIFFGIFGVTLNCYLHLSVWSWMSLLPAAAVGLMSVAVLNLNNMRDMESDALAGKNTIAIALGFKASKWYQYSLTLLPFLFVF
ncbi:MAG: 1,4-dihydroxy-2-naphthoate octaprenyltransferase, partial [Flavobacteriales bacterium]